MTADPKKVFIIHGRNIAAKNAVEQFVRVLGLEPIDFDELSASLGGSAFVGDVVREGLNRAQGIIALFTPDEFSALRPEHRDPDEREEEKQRWQARPNVIFEAGMAFGMDWRRTVLVTIGGTVSLFSDVGGVHVVRLTNAVPSRGKLRTKLIGMHCDLNQQTNAWTDPERSGDFEACISALREVSPADPFREVATDSAESVAAKYPGMSDEAGDVLDGIRAAYVKAGFPSHPTWIFSPREDQRAAYAELRANSWIEPFGGGEKNWRLTDIGQALARRRD